MDFQHTLSPDFPSQSLKLFFFQVCVSLLYATTTSQKNWLSATYQSYHKDSLIDMHHRLDKLRDLTHLSNLVGLCDVKQIIELNKISVGLKYFLTNIP